jgi:hypothetical protein
MNWNRCLFHVFIDYLLGQLLITGRDPELLPTICADNVYDLTIHTQLQVGKGGVKLFRLRGQWHILMEMKKSVILVSIKSVDGK